MNREKRTPVIAGNWKMNSGSPAEASALLGGLLEACPKAPACEVVVCPPATALALAADTLRGSAIALGAQNCHFAPSGAYTGEIANAAKTRVEVRTEITMKDGTRVPVAYRMMAKDNSWRVYDIIVENLSLVKNYRTQFQDILTSGTPDELIARVKAKAEEVRKQPVGK